ncbi:outer dynein arm-docking complex subunit 2-like isoform X2 [Paramacrobiotus metropolitanus]|uniref:outer dynein arm-docking complex subunit 2-like isoform X2 n=1 Tax=Paramacrobiotus metropolitanus TaxID=2943436 RepID=UPI0024461007|nr:outer dynein arm-docking complex subunit 2-like isoform X2 [Paramacrobiotus metropolitanus]
MYPCLISNDYTQERGYHRLDDQFVIISDEADGEPYLDLQVDDQDRRLLTVWNVHQLAVIIGITEKTWDMEIASVLFFQPDPVAVMFGDKYDTRNVEPHQMLPAVSHILEEMELSALEQLAYQRLYMLLQQFDLLYLYRRLFVNAQDSAYLDPNLPYRELSMLEEMAAFEDDAPLKGIALLNDPREWGWAAPLHRQLYGDVAYVIVITNNDAKHCLTINITGIYENNLINDENGYGTPNDSNVKTMVQWLRENDQYFREHFVRAAYRYDTRLGLERDRVARGHIDAINIVLPPRKFVAMDRNRRLFLLDHLENKPAIKRKSGFWLRLREVHKNLYSANRVLYRIMKSKSKLFKGNSPPDERMEEERRVEYLSRSEVKSDSMGLGERFHPGALEAPIEQDEHFPEAYSYDPKTKLDDNQVRISSGEASILPDFWPLFRAHRMIRYGCADSICAGAMMVSRATFLKESNAAAFHQFPIVEVLLNLCEASLKEYGRQKLEALELLTRMTNCKFTLRQINFFSGIKAIIQALQSRYLEVKCAAAVCLTMLMEAVWENKQILGRDGGIPLLLKVMQCQKTKPEDYWYADFRRKHKRVWPEEILAVTSAQAANAVWLALRERRNRYDFVQLGGIVVCQELLLIAKHRDYAIVPVTGILAELAQERQNHLSIVNSGALTAMCRVLKGDTNEDVFQNVASVIALVCEMDAARECIRAAGGLSHLLKPLHVPFSSGCVQITAEALHAVAGSVLNCEVLKNTKVTDLVIGRLYEGSGETTVFHLLGFLSEMARVEGCRHYIRSSGVLPFVIDYMFHENQHIRMIAALTAGRMGADADSYNTLNDANGIVHIWDLINIAYAPIVCVHACMAIYPLFVARPQDTAKVIKTIVNPFGQMFALFDVRDYRVLDSVLNLTCLLAHDDDLLAMMSDLGFCTIIAKQIDTTNVRLLRLVTEAIAVGSEYAINRINFSTTSILPKIAKLLWHPDEEIQTNALLALHELTKYPQNIIQIHADRVVRRLLSYVMEDGEQRARHAAGCLRHLRYLAMANMGDTYNFEDTFFPLRSEEDKAIHRTKRELLTKKLVPEAKAEADKMIQRVHNEKRMKMQYLPITPVSPAPEFTESDWAKLPSVLRKLAHDPELDADVPIPDELFVDARALVSAKRDKRRDSTHVRNDRRDDEWRTPTEGQEVESIVAEKEWWMNEFDEENHRLFNRLTIKNNILDNNVDRSVVRARPFEEPQPSNNFHGNE